MSIKHRNEKICKIYFFHKKFSHLDLFSNDTMYFLLKKVVADAKMNSKNSYTVTLTEVECRKMGNVEFRNVE